VGGQSASFCWLKPANYFKALMKKQKINTERVLFAALIAVAFFGFLLWSIQQTQLEEENLLASWLGVKNPAQNETIKVTSPKPNGTIKSPVKVAGQAAVFEAVLKIRVKDAANLVLAEKTVMTSEGQKMSPFSAKITYKKPSRPKGTIEFFTNSPKDGSETNKLIIPVTFND